MTIQDANGNLHSGNGRFATKPSVEGATLLRNPDRCGPHDAANRPCRAFPDQLDPEAPHHTRHAGLAEVLAATRHWPDTRGLDFETAIEAAADKEPVLPPGPDHLIRLGHPRQCRRRRRLPPAHPHLRIRPLIPSDVPRHAAHANGAGQEVRRAGEVLVPDPDGKEAASARRENERGANASAVLRDHLARTEGGPIWLVFPSATGGVLDQATSADSFWASP